MVDVCHDNQSVRRSEQGRARPLWAAPRGSLKPEDIVTPGPVFGFARVLGPSGQLNIGAHRHPDILAESAPLFGPFPGLIQKFPFYTGTMNSKTFKQGHLAGHGQDQLIKTYGSIWLRSRSEEALIWEFYLNDAAPAPPTASRNVKNN
jgi:hypothetical protein